MPEYIMWPSIQGLQLLALIWNDQTLYLYLELLCTMIIVFYTCTLTDSEVLGLSELASARSK